MRDFRNDLQERANLIDEQIKVTLTSKMPSSNLRPKGRQKSLICNRALQ